MATVLNQIIKIFYARIRIVLKIGSYFKRIIFLILIGSFFFANCNKDNGNQNILLFLGLFSHSNQDGFRLNTTLRASGSSNGLTSSQLSTNLGFGAGEICNENVQGLYILYMDAIAFDYRPGQETQESMSSGFEMFAITNKPTDWSHWWLIPPPGYTARNYYSESYNKSINNVIKIDEVIKPEFYQLGSISGKRDFEIDAFSLTINAPGLVYNNEYFGTLWGPDSKSIDGKHPLNKYPQWANSPTHVTAIVFPGFHYLMDEPGHTFFNDNSISVIYIRKDILTAPVQIQITEEAYTDPGKYLSVGYTSRPLSKTENDFFLSMLRQSYPILYHMQYILIPFDGPITIGFDGQTDEKQKRFLWNETEVQIGFDLSNIIHEDSQISYSLNSSIIKIRGDANNVPFGMNMKFVRKNVNQVFQ
ncbi:hypothetical protein HGB47_08160 [Leptospira yasudae]|uniref:hypothetical protein n=1 Tax=Leptospira yasudae TaxID=2202201 RepID=UPI001C4E33BA|nr:hypothetical protein [Leptospira yasudae]MBW0433588.1 hypothetical protein [Leptospira yasudae]